MITARAQRVRRVTFDAQQGQGLSKIALFWTVKSEVRTNHKKQLYSNKRGVINAEGGAVRNVLGVSITVYSSSTCESLDPRKHKQLPHTHTPVMCEV